MIRRATRPSTVSRPPASAPLRGLALSALTALTAAACAGAADPAPHTAPGTVPADAARSAGPATAAPDSAPGVAGTAVEPLTLVSYNIHAGQDARGERNLRRVAAVLDTLGADVVLLQEVDRGTARSGREDQVAALERETGLHGAFGKSLDYQGGDYGIAVLSRWPIRSVHVWPLPVEPPLERAGGLHQPLVALHVVVDSPDGPLHVVDTHLVAEGPGTNRKQQLVGLLAHIRRRVPAGEPLVLGGDFNAVPESDEAAAVTLALRDAWTACGSGGGETYPSDGPTRRIDYLFLRNVDCVDAAVHPTTASDHRPLTVTARMR